MAAAGSSRSGHLQTTRFLTRAMSQNVTTGHLLIHRRPRRKRREDRWYELTSESSEAFSSSSSSESDDPEAYIPRRRTEYGGSRACYLPNDRRLAKIKKDGGDGNWAGGSKKAKRKRWKDCIVS